MYRQLVILNWILYVNQDFVAEREVLIFYYEILRYHFKLKIVGKRLLRFLMIISSDQDVLWETVPFFHDWLKIAY